MAYGPQWGAFTPKKFKPFKPVGLPTVKPPAPIVKPPTAVAPPGAPASLQDQFKNWYQTDPRFLQQNPQFANQRGNLYAQYGWQPNGSGGYTASGADQNPFSVVNQLKQALAGQSQNVQDSANSRGLLFSGAQVQGQQNATTGYESKLSDAQQAFQQALGGVNQNEANLITSLYDDYVKTAPPGGNTPTAVAATPVAAAASAAAKEADRQARIKKAQDHLAADKAKAAKLKPPVKRKRPNLGGSQAGGAKGYVRP